MLNITTRISLSKQSKRIIKKHKKINNGLSSSSWKNIDSYVKNEISKKLLAAHSPKCVYCERYFIAVKNEIDHFAHKAIYSDFTFTTVNLFTSCEYCNSSTRKGQKPTVEMPANKRYNLCDFTIVHPYYHIPHEEIIFKDEDRVDFDWDECSDIGKDTITFFGWGDKIMTMLRAKVIKRERLEPLTTEGEKELIALIITYKK